MGHAVNDGRDDPPGPPSLVANYGPFVSTLAIEFGEQFLQGQGKTWQYPLSIEDRIYPQGRRVQDRPIHRNQTGIGVDLPHQLYASRKIVLSFRGHLARCVATT